MWVHVAASSDSPWTQLGRLTQAFMGCQAAKAIGSMSEDLDATLEVKESTLSCWQIVDPAFLQHVLDRMSPQKVANRGRRATPVLGAARSSRQYLAVPAVISVDIIRSRDGCAAPPAAMAVASDFPLWPRANLSPLVQRRQPQNPGGMHLQPSTRAFQAAWRTGRACEQAGKIWQAKEGQAIACQEIYMQAKHKSAQKDAEPPQVEQALPKGDLETLRWYGAGQVEQSGALWRDQRNAQHGHSEAQH